MVLIDRRGFSRAGFCSGLPSPLGGWPCALKRCARCRSTTASQAPSTIGSRRLRWSSLVRAGALDAASGVAGGVEAAASAVGAGCN